MRYGVLMALMFLCAGCGRAPEEVSKAPAAAAPDQPLLDLAAAPAKDATPNAMTMEGVDLYMHDYTPTAGKLREPTFWVHADSGQLAVGDQVWSLQNTHAVIYRADDEDVIVEAVEGEFDQEKEIAFLTGSVRLTVGSLVVELERLAWDNKLGTATSDDPVRVTEGDTRLIASRLRIDPEKNELHLEEGSGYLPLVETTP